MAAYGGKTNHLRYTCMRATIDYGAPGCLSLAGAFLERFVATQIMHVLGDLRTAVTGLAEAINTGYKGCGIGELVVTRPRPP